MESSQFSDSQPRFEGMEPMESHGAFCDTFRVKLYGKLHFLKRLKAEYAGDIRFQEALRKEYPDIPESVIIQHAESRFHSLVGYVFNRMRENGLQQ